MNLDHHLNALVTYGLDHHLFAPSETDGVIERLAKALGVKPWTFKPNRHDNSFESMVRPLLDHAYKAGFFTVDTTAERDAFEAFLMDAMMPAPKVVKAHFKALHDRNPDQAARYLYDLSIAVNYIKAGRLKQNIEWVHPSPYGRLQMTINLAKPEKDPRDIAAAKKVETVRRDDIPLCVLCKENEQHYHNARMNLRIVPVTLGGEPWHFQYSPYLYYHEHAIILHDEHKPMWIKPKTFTYLLDFLDLFPGYFIGSNADLPIVGGSILNHDHFQAGRHVFPIEEATIDKTFDTGLNLMVEAVNWPMSTIRLQSQDRSLLERTATRFLEAWKTYQNPGLEIIAHTHDDPHNTVTPIARVNDGIYTLDLILRNNRTSDEHPLGIFHPHADVQHIKKENIGLIEAMGLAILPGRLKEELNIILEALKHDASALPDALAHHQDWYEILKTHNIHDEDGLFKAVGSKFERVLEDASVFKRDEQGQHAFHHFILSVIHENK